MRFAAIQSVLESLLPQPISEEICPHIFDYAEIPCNLRFMHIRNRFLVKIPHLYIDIVKDGNVRKLYQPQGQWERTPSGWRIKTDRDSSITIDNLSTKITYQQAIETSLARKLVFSINFRLEESLPHYEALFSLRDRYYYDEIQYREMKSLTESLIADSSGDILDPEDFGKLSWFYRFFESGLS